MHKTNSKMRFKKLQLSLLILCRKKSFKTPKTAYTFFKRSGSRNAKFLTADTTAGGGSEACAEGKGFNGGVIQ